ncbi:MAG: anti-sigma factor [Acidobacteria bacterium]|nr:anti-sigma factor [Acidobacteriota bacterium]
MNRPDISAEDLALYAMHLLSDEDRFAVEQFLATSSEARQELATIRGDLASFAMGVEMHSPPTLARQRLMKEVAREKKAVPFAGFEPAEAAAHISSQSEPETQFLRSYQQAEDHHVAEHRGWFGVIFPWVGWVAAAGLTFYAIFVTHDRDQLQARVRRQATELSIANESAERARLVMDTLTAASTQKFVLTKVDVKPPATGRVAYLPERGSLLFQGANLDPLPDAKTYELWLIPAGDGAKPIAAGTFKPDRQGFAQIMLPDMPKGLTVSKFGVTVEDDGGAEEPTMPIVMIGQ